MKDNIYYLEDFRAKKIKKKQSEMIKGIIALSAHLYPEEEDSNEEG